MDTTLEPAKPLSNQEIFNRAWNHFVVNKAPKSTASLESSGLCACVYRGDGTPECQTRCAVGILIPDNEYDKRFDDGTYCLRQIVDKVSTLKGADYTFLSMIQSKHDSTTNSNFHVEVRDNLTELAEEYDLTIPNDHTL